MQETHLMAHVLLDDFFELDVPEIAAAYSAKYPQFGKVTFVDDLLLDAATTSKSMMMTTLWSVQSGSEAPFVPECNGIEIEGARFAVRLTLCPFLYDLENEGLRPVRTWNPADALTRCRAFISIAPVEMATDPDIVKSQAIVLQTLASFVAIGTEALAIHWETSFGFQQPDSFEATAMAAASGKLPIDDWIQYYFLIVDENKNKDGEQISGMATLGLRPFLGREIEIAPRRSTMVEHIKTTFAASWLLLQKNAVFNDKDTMGDDEGGSFHHIRILPHYYREGYPAYLMISPDSVLDPETLAQKKKRGIVSRLLRR